MARVYSQSWIRDILNTTLVYEKAGFTAHVIEGIENFNLKKVFRATVRTNFSGRTGVYFDNFDEAKADAIRILDEEIIHRDNKREENRKAYDVE